MTYNLYADVIFFNNFTMDFLLLTLLQRMMRLEKRKAGLLSASTLGAGYALAVTIYPIENSFLQAVITYVLISAVMVWAAFRIKDRRSLLKGVAGLYLTSVMAAGIFNLLQVQGGISWYAEQIFFRKGFREIPFFVYLLAAAGVFFLICFLWETVKTAEADQSHLYSVVVYYRGRSESMTAFMDTGNRLTEPYSLKPVSVVSADCCKELFKTVTSVLYIPYNSVGKKDGVLPAVKADRMEIEKEGRRVVIEEPYIAISKASLSPEGHYQMLLNEKLWL